MAWKEFTDPGTGATYYYNAATQETTWTKPPDFVAEAVAATPVAQVTAQVANVSVDDTAAQLPPGWQQYRDNQGRPYYYNASTSATSWTWPTASTGATTALPAAVAAEPAQPQRKDWRKRKGAAPAQAAPAQAQAQPAADQAHIPAWQRYKNTAQEVSVIETAPAVWQPPEEQADPAVWQPSEDEPAVGGFPAGWKPPGAEEEVTPAVWQPPAEEQEVAPAVWQPPAEEAPTTLPSTHASASKPNQLPTTGWGAGPAPEERGSGAFFTGQEVDDDIGGIPYTCNLNVGDKGAGLRFIYETDGWWIYQVLDNPGQPELKVNDLVVGAGGQTITNLAQPAQVNIMKGNFKDGATFEVRRGLMMPDGFMNEANQFVYIKPGQRPPPRNIPGLGVRPATRYIICRGLGARTPWPKLRHLIDQEGHGKATRTEMIWRNVTKTRRTSSGQCICEMPTHHQCYQILTKMQGMELDGKTLSFDVAEGFRYPSPFTDEKKLNQLDEVAKFLVKKLKGESSEEGFATSGLHAQLRFKFARNDNRKTVENDIMFMIPSHFYNMRPEFEVLRDPLDDMDKDKEEYGTQNKMHGLMEHNHNMLLIRLTPQYGGATGAVKKHMHSFFARESADQDRIRERDRVLNKRQDKGRHGVPKGGAKKSTFLMDIGRKF